MNSVVLRDTRDESGSRRLAATINSDGDLVIAGQDLGPGVKEILGASEYEWQWTVAAADCKQLLDALGATTDLLSAIEQRFSGDRSADIKSFLDDKGIPHDTWSRIGD